MQNDTVFRVKEKAKQDLKQPSSTATMSSVPKQGRSLFEKFQPIRAFHSEWLPLPAAFIGWVVYIFPEDSRFRGLSLNITGMKCHSRFLDFLPPLVFITCWYGDIMQLFSADTTVFKKTSSKRISNSKRELRIEGAKRIFLVKKILSIISFWNSYGNSFWNSFWNCFGILF